MSNAQNARKHFASHRQIARNLRLRRYQGRNGAATERGLTYHFESGLAALRQLPKGLQGEIWAEHQLASRVSQARDNGVKRPELQRRLNAHRRTIKAAA